MTTTAASERSPFEMELADIAELTFDQVPPAFTAVGASRLYLDKAVRKSGASSLCWEWRGPDAALVFQDDTVFRQLSGRQEPTSFDWPTHNRVSAIGFWLYAAQPLAAPIVFEVGDGQTASARFEVFMPRGGWRYISGLWGRDVPGFPDADKADRLTARPPQGVPAGRICLDNFTPRFETDVRFFVPSEATPWVYPAAALPQPDVAVVADLSEQQEQTLATLRERLLEPYRNARRRPGMAAVAERFDRWQIRPHDGSVTGAPLLSADVNAYWDLVADIARTASATTEGDARARLHEMAVLMARHYLRQGWAPGNRSAHPHHGVRQPAEKGFASALLLLRDCFREEGLYGPLVESFWDLGSGARFFEEEPHYRLGIGNRTRNALCGALLFDDGSAWPRVQAIHRWLEQGVGSGDLKPDGCLYHHGQHYTGYNMRGAGCLIDCVEIFKVTAMPLPRCHEAVRRFAWISFFAASGTELPHVWGGRWRSGTLSVGLYNRLAMLGTPDGGSSFDTETASMFLRLSGHVTRPNLQKRYAPSVAEFRQRGVDPAPLPQGHLSLNYAATGIHRRGDWVAAISGMTPYAVGTEIYGYQHANDWGRYIHYGNLQLTTRGSSLASGFDPKRGWDFNHNPGTTCRKLPYERLTTQFLVEEHLSEETFSGSTNLHGNGVYGMKLQEHVPVSTGPPRRWLGKAEFDRRVEQAAFDETFRARKSYFFFDNRIICLGSGIGSRDERFPVVTTLLQTVVPDGAPGHLTVDGEPTADFRRWRNRALHLENAVGNHYFIPAQDAPLATARQEQTRPYYTSPREGSERRDGTGIVETAWFDHGRAPAGGAYHYAILVAPEPAEVAAFAQAAPYTVLQQDDQAHVVHDPATKSTGFVVFDADEFGGHGVLRGVSRPCLLLTRLDDDGHLHIAATDPDLGPGAGGASKLPTGISPSYPVGTTVRVSLAGRWALAASVPGVSLVADADQPHTQLSIHCHDGMPVALELRPRP